MTSATDAPGAGRISLESKVGRWVIAATVLGAATTQLTGTVVNVALPALGRDLDAGVAGLQWVVNGYMLSLAALILVGGSLGDRLGRRRIFVVGTVWFTVASVLCALAPTLPLLVAARVLQGVGGALLTPGSLAIIQATFVASDRPRAIGLWSALGGVAAAVGPPIGGWLVEVSTWRAVFLLNVPFAMAVLLAARRVPESRDPAAPARLDWAGSAAGALALAALTWGFIAAGSRGMDLAVVTALVAGVAAAVTFVVVERRATSPMLPPGIFSSPQFTWANVLTFMVYAALSVLFFLLVVYLQSALGYRPVVAGLAGLPVTILMFLLSARGGELAQRIGPRVPLTVGPLLIAGGFALLTRLDPQSTYVADVLPGLVVLGLGLSATVAPVTATVLAAVDDAHTGIASGINNAVARTAGLVAVAVVPVLVGLTEQDYADPVAFTESFGMAMWLIAGLAAAGGVVGWLRISDDVLADRAATHPLSCGVVGPPPIEVPRADLGHDGDMAEAVACSHLDTIDWDVEPTPPDACGPCLEAGLDWVGLRMCMGCGHVGCCDTSPGRHASAHARPGHLVMRSYEPGETWWYCHADDVTWDVRGLPPLRGAV
jgi:EmrB/QacA subfamily drug resistance transporter